MCGLWTGPRTDVDPPRVELPSAGRISSRRRGDSLLLRVWRARAEAVRLRFVRLSVRASVCQAAYCLPDLLNISRFVV